MPPGSPTGRKPLSNSGRRLRDARWVQWAFWGGLAALPVGFLLVFFVFPVTKIMALGFLPDGQLDLGSTIATLQANRTWRAAGNTLTQAGLATLLCVALGVPGAYVLYRLEWPGRSLVRTIVAIPFVLPTVVVAVAFRALLAEGGPLAGLRLDGSLIALLAAMVFYNYGIVVRIVGGLWEKLDPRSEQAAQSLGASPTRAFLTVTLPALLPAILSAASLVFLFCATAYALVLVLGGPTQVTLEVEIWLQTTQFLNLPAASVLSLLQLVVVLASLIVANWTRSKSETSLRLLESSSISATRSWPKPGLHGWFSIVLCTLVVAMIVLPMATLVLRSIHDDQGWTFRYFAMLIDSSTSGVSIWEALQKSLRVAFDATLLALIVGVALAIILARRPTTNAGTRLLAGLDGFAMLPLGVSAVIVGFGFLIALDHPPLDLRSSTILVPIAQAMVAMPLVVRTVLPVLRGINNRQLQAAMALGASPIRVLTSIELPIAGKSIGLAAGFAFAISMGEFGATSFLARPNDPTLPVAIYRLLSRPGEGNYELAMAASVLLAGVVALVMGVAERLRPSYQAGW